MVHDQSCAMRVSMRRIACVRDRDVRDVLSLYTRDSGQTVR